MKEIKLYSGNGPRFTVGSDLGIKADILKDGGWSSFPITFIDSLGKGYSIFSGEQKSNSFKVKEIEVFKLFN